MCSSLRIIYANYWKVMTANFSMSFAFYLLTPLLPLYLSEDFNASKDVIGLVLSGYTLTALLVRPFSGFVVDSFPRKKVLLVSLFLYFLFFGTYLLASSLLLFALELLITAFSPCRDRSHSSVLYTIRFSLPLQ